MSKNEEKYCFLVEWKDTSTDTLRKFMLYFYPRDSTVEMFDTRSRKMFLRRTDCEVCRLRDFFPGNLVYVLSRHLKILSYGDSQTEAFLSPKHERTVVLLKSSGVPRVGEVWELLQRNGFNISNAIMLKLLPVEAEKYFEISGISTTSVDEISDNVICLEVMGERVVARCKNLLSHALADDPGHVLDKHCLVSSDKETARKEREFFFGVQRSCNTALLQHTTCCILKPHVFREGHVYNILQAITHAGFQISALEMKLLESDKAEEFLEVYKGVVPDFQSVVQSLADGPCLVLEVCGEPPFQTPIRFKEFVGPTDPFYARKLYPDTVRGKFGRDIHRNAVHCTDVADDAIAEIMFFFV
ncbi:nucleoside diphosphate kinase homolog 7-like [Ornithodoros turicata]|uniref:nucleoside diphosphate kinase homolog 7-like n=1 Tax=Ornithodoros turicata TaxID=34597 RepID=UPI003138EF84